MRRVRIAVAVGGIAAAALLPALVIVQQLAASPNWYRPGEDSISAFERRYAPLRAALGTTTVVGYLPAASQDSAEARAQFYMSRYALAPVQVVDGLDAALVVADGVTDRGRLPAAFSVRRDFGRGLLLLERTGSPPP